MTCMWEEYALKQRYILNWHINYLYKWEKKCLFVNPRWQSHFYPWLNPPIEPLLSKLSADFACLMCVGFMHVDALYCISWKLLLWICFSASIWYHIMYLYLFDHVVHSNISTTSRKLITRAGYCTNHWRGEKKGTTTILKRMLL